MPVYDHQNRLSAEAPALYEMATFLSECSHWQTLCEQASAASARTKIKIGVNYGPWDGDRYDLDELAETFCEAHLTWPLEGGRIVARSDGSVTPEESGTFVLTIRRLVRKSESESLKQDAGLDLWFLDVISALEQQIIEDSESRACPRLQSIERIGGPAVSNWDEETAQGQYLWVQHSITWGDEIGIGE